MKPKYRRILFVGREKNIRPLPADLPETMQLLRQYGCEPLLDESIINIIGDNTEKFNALNVPLVAAGEDEEVDLVVVLGGDGTFLGAARRYAPRGNELVGVNLGYLGFLTDIASDAMQPVLLDILAGKSRSESRFMLSVTYNGAPPANDLSVAINDVVISRGASGVLLQLRVYIDDVFAYTLRADGLIISTPSGSTAYALSAGGPIIAADLASILLVPLCPHALTHRPLVVCADYAIRVEVVQGKMGTAHIDGQGDLSLSVGDVIEVRRHPKPLNICHPLSYDYYQTLRKKLLWGE